MKKLITDTNVWYGLSRGLYDCERLTKDYILCPTTINILEILSKINSQNFEKRKNALLMIRPYLSNILSSNDRYLDNLWRIKNTENLTKIYITNYFEAINCATSFSEFEKRLSAYRGVFSIETLRKHQESEWNTMKADIENIMTMWKPDYKISTSSSMFQFMNKRLAGRTEIELGNQAYIDWVTAALYVRANGKKQNLFDKYFNYAQSILLPYINVYKYYLLHCATTSPAEENDYGDLELFLYGSLMNENGNDYFLGTAEKKWHVIAKKSGLANVIDTGIYKAGDD